jgi:hypothetical protein
MILLIIDFNGDSLLMIILLLSICTVWKRSVLLLSFNVVTIPLFTHPY